jgi:CO/xanthine dehydrogenase FAD-binding subunit
MIDLVVPLEIGELRELAPTGRIIAGGTDLLVRMRNGGAESRLIDVTNLVDGPPIVSARNGSLHISALAPISDVAAAVGSRLPAFTAAVGAFGSTQIRNRATIGGNLANASPAADLAVVLVAAGAVALVDGLNGRREVPVEALAAGPGKVDLDRGEWISSVSVPVPPGAEGFRKLGGRLAHAIAIVNLAWRWDRASDGTLTDVRLAFGAVAPTVVRVTGAEAELEGRVPTRGVIEQAMEAAAAEVSPIDDVRASARYRRAMVAELVREVLTRHDVSRE